MSEPIKILYVEDEEFLAKIVIESLERKGYEVYWAADGQAGLALVDQIIPQICILDIMLPFLDGFSLGKLIRKKLPETPIIFLTAKSQIEDVLNGFQSGGNDYIKKPFSLEELMARINNLLYFSIPKHQSGKEELIVIGDYFFNESRLELSYGQKVQKLTYREGQILKYLYDHREKPINRRTLLKELWGDDNQFNSRNLDVYILKLRQFFKEDNTVQIVTLKGEGYRFVC